MSSHSPILAPVVGALISGVIGIATVEYRNYRSDISETQGWYEQAIRLSAQVKHETPESYIKDIQGRGEADETNTRANDMLDSYGRIGERLRDHVNQAPPNVRDDVLESATEAGRYCRMISRSQNIQLDEVEKALESANNLNSRSKQAEDSVGVF